MEMPFVLVDQARSGPDRPVTLTVPIGEGQLPEGETLIVQDSRGRPIPSQWNKLTSWRTDRSVLFGMVTFLTQSSGNNAGDYKVVQGTPEAGPAVTKAEIVESGFDAVVSAVIDGVTYSLSARDLLNGAVTARKDYTYFSGPLCSSYALGGPLRAEEAGEHSSIQAHFEVRGFRDSGGVARVYVTCTLENTGADNETFNTPASAVDIEVGGGSLPGFPKSDFTIYADYRYTARAWYGGDPGIYAVHDMAYVQRTRLFPTYRTEEGVSSRLLDAMEATPVWNSLVLTNVSNAGGTKPDLAPFERWTAAYIMSGGDARARNGLRVVHDEYQAIGWSNRGGLQRPRSEKTGHPIDMATDDRVSQEQRGASAQFAAHRDRTLSYNNAFNVSHMPSMGFSPAVFFGEFNDIESMLFSGIAAWINTRPGGYVGTIPNRRFGPGYSARNKAWAFREILNAGVLCPDDHPLRATMDAAVGNAIRELNERLRPYDLSDRIGADLCKHNVAYRGNSLSADWKATNPQRASVGYPPWMDDWLTWSIGRAYYLGWRSELESTGLYAWKVQALLGRFGTTLPGYCWQHAAVYALAMFDEFDHSQGGDAPPGAYGTPYASWAEVYEKNFGSVDQCARPGAPIGIYTRADGRSVNRDPSATSYGAQIAAALADAVDMDIPGAAEAWALYDGRDRSIWQRSRQRTYGGAPEWAIKPSRYA